MRRYLFVFTVAFAVIVLFFENMGFGFDNDIVMHSGGTRSYEGKVIRIDKAAEGYKIRVRTYGESGDVLLRYYDGIENPWEMLRSEISFEAELSLPKKATNPHCFDYRRYLMSEAIYYTAATKNICVTGRKYSIYDRYLRYLEKEKNLFCDCLDEKLRGIVMGVIFGDTSYMSEELYEVFKRNGTAHILAVSGLHIGIFYNIFKKLNGRRRNAAGVIFFIFVLLSYGALASWSPSVIRATAMILMSMAARLFCLRYDRLSALAAIALILMLYNPFIIHSIAFQMSFFAIIAIDVFTKVMPTCIPENIKTTLAVNSALIIYQAYVFNYISVVSFFLNIPVIFISGIFVPLAVFCFISYCLFGVTAPFIPTMNFLSDIMIKINEISAAGGRGAIDVTSPPIFFVILIGASLVVICSETFKIYRLRGEKNKVGIIFVLILVISAAAGIFNYESISYDDMVFIDVGQGNATHIRESGKNVLIDGGGNYRYNIGKNTLKQYFLKNGENKVDLALATHRDTDHYKGIIELRECFEVGNFFDKAVMGDAYEVSGRLKIITLWPREKDCSTDDENENGSVFLIIHKGVRTLIAGDIGVETENEIISYYRETGKISMLDADILNVGHHGSKTSTSAEFLDVVSPGICIIQVGKNSYGHPAEEVIERIYDRRIPIFRNDCCGAIGIRIKKGKKVEVHKMIDE